MADKLKQILLRAGSHSPSRSCFTRNSRPNSGQSADEHGAPTPAVSLLFLCGDPRSHSAAQEDCRMPSGRSGERWADGKVVVDSRISENVLLTSSLPQIRQHTHKYTCRTRKANLGCCHCCHCCHADKDACSPWLSLQTDEAGKPRDNQHNEHTSLGGSLFRAFRL